MGEALASGLLRAGWEPDEISMAVRRQERRRELIDKTGCVVSLEPAEALSGKEVLVVAVKPRDVPHLISQIQGSYQPAQLILSLAAGVIAGLVVRGLAITYHWSLPSFGTRNR